MNHNILITSAGRRVSLVKMFQAEAKRIFGSAAEILTTDLNPQFSSACTVADRAFKVGRFSDPDYLDSILNICKENNVGILIPTIDTELLMLAGAQQQFAEIGCHVIISDPDMITICRDKRKTNTFFSDKGFGIPVEYDVHHLQFPLFAKPYNGSSSNNLLLALTVDDIAPNMLRNNEMMFLEYLSKREYEEYTIDIYFDRAGEIKCIVPRLRIETRQGEMSKGLTCKNHLVAFVLDHLNHIKGFRGCITLQVFSHKTTNKVYGIEINPRFGGGFPLSNLAGAHFPQWIINEYLLDNTLSYTDSWEDNLLLLRHDTELIVRNGTNQR